MEASPERDSTRDWLLPEHARPPLLSELEARIDEALATARASEAAVMTVGAAALDAAELAERASSMLLGPATGGDRLREFTEHADRVAGRLQKLARTPVANGR